tara:strand:- start:291 stop:1235 length:945 start_codon:yes stop_codon:yes gene_type:complete
MLKNYKPILIVAGEPHSVFLEIFFKTLKKKKIKNSIILIVNKKILINQLQLLKFNFKINEMDKNLKLNEIKQNHINFINVDFKSKYVNKYIKNSFEIAIKLLKQNKNLGLINGPINKKKFLKNRYFGITEYLGSKTNSLKKVVMLIYGKKISVSPITTHIPLKKVHLNISKNRIVNHVKLINDFYKLRFKIKPKVAITGLNPHCESNFTSSEEDKIIIPAINILKKKKYKVSGPYPADTIFLKQNMKNYDVIVGMYHDQVLSPIKSILGFNAINLTIGLPFTRVSPDHGPNVRMFGKNLSDPQSLIEAIKFFEN